MSHDSRTSPKRPQSRAEAADEQGPSACCPTSRTARTSALEAQPCRLCGKEIQPRRRNGFCSDRCRMRFRRGEERKRLEKLFENVDAALHKGTSSPVVGDSENLRETLAALRREVLS